MSGERAALRSLLNPPPPPPTPTCKRCGVDLERRTNPTPADAELGAWYDHPPATGGHLIGHTTTYLRPSAALAAELKRQAPAVDLRRIAETLPKETP